ncbi:MAG: hypothetical protein IJJ63_00890 [Bacilli bacterium]|nr:hypothetical protein [Bacilli bacterium]MBQ6404583.1 hypothetical protein [Bacilli bacterium]
MADNYESIPLDLWIMNHPKEEDIRTVFINMDIALKYIHEHGYCIEVFYPSEIEILNNELDHIQFKKLIELSRDPAIKQQMIKEDLFNSALMQIGLYFYSDGLGLSINMILYNLKPEILKENFDAYSQVIPEGDTPYYRGIILRGATVYLCEFVQEKNNRELQELEKQLAPDDQKNFEPAQIKKVPSNNKVNDNIYRQINGLRDAAFISVLTIPTVIIIVMIIIMIFSWVISIG